MTTLEMRGFRKQVLGKLREYEGHVRRLEGQIMVLRGKAERTTGEAHEQLGKLLADIEREAEVVRGAGRAALEGLEGAVATGREFLGRVKDRLVEMEVSVPSVVAKGREAIRRASIEARALRHGVKVGLRVAKRVSKQAKAAKS